MDPSIIMSNYGGDFIDSVTAEEIVKIVIDRKYPKSVFILNTISCEDSKDNWKITVKNGMHDLQESVNPQYMTFYISKVDGAIKKIR